MTFHGGCIHLLKMTKKEKGSCIYWEAVWIFRCSISNVLRSSDHLLLFTNQFLSYFFLPSPELRILDWLAADGATSLRSKVPADGCALLPRSLGTTGMPQMTTVLSTFWKPASRTSRPVYLADDFRVSNYLSFSNKRSKSHSGSPWLLERCLQWTTPRSSCTPPGFRSNVSTSVDRHSVLCLITDLIHFSFS